jgi:hypothetical protein
MIVTIHQPEHLPWLGFFDKMRQVDVFVLLDTTQFAKRDFQNRNRIKTAQGAVWLTVPVYTKGRFHQRIMDVEIYNDRNWYKRHWSLLYESYRDAPYFEPHRAFFEDLFDQEWDKLASLNLAIIRYMAQQLGLSTELLTASEMGIYEQGSTAVLLAICRQIGADVYLSGRFGREYLDEARFDKHGIQVIYQDFKHPVYRQLHGDFLPNMSAVDLLFNHGEASLDIIRQANALVRGEKQL